MVIAGELNVEARTVLARAEDYRCVTPDDYARAADLGEELRAMEAVIDQRLGPIIDDAYRTHRALTALRAELKAPILTGYKAVMRAAAEWREAQERAEREEAARLAREQQASERARAEREAKQLEATGDVQAAAEVRQEAASAPVPAVHVATAVPKARSAGGGGLVPRDEWGFEIVDEGKIPDEYWVVDKPSLAAVVKRQKDACRIPGIRVFKTAATSFRRGK